MDWNSMTAGQVRQAVRNLLEEQAGLDYKIKHGRGSAEALRRMAARSRQINGLVGQAPLLVSSRNPLAEDIMRF